MKKRFTLVELALVVFCVALLAALALGITPRERAREVHCTDKMRNLLKISHQYVTDHRGMWMAPCNTKNGAYFENITCSPAALMVNLPLSAPSGVSARN